MSSRDKAAICDLLCQRFSLFPCQIFPHWVATGRAGFFALQAVRKDFISLIERRETTGRKKDKFRVYFISAAQYPEFTYFRQNFFITQSAKSAKKNRAICYYLLLRVLRALRGENWVAAGRAGTSAHLWAEQFHGKTGLAWGRALTSAAR
jgi:hypothetical protein